MPPRAHYAQRTAAAIARRPQEPAGPLTPYSGCGCRKPSGCGPAPGPAERTARKICRHARHGATPRRVGARPWPFSWALRDLLSGRRGRGRGGNRPRASRLTQHRSAVSPCRGPQVRSGTRLLLLKQKPRQHRSRLEISAFVLPSYPEARQTPGCVTGAHQELPVTETWF